jgi:hypothetical protein
MKWQVAICLRREPAFVLRTLVQTFLERSLHGQSIGFAIGKPHRHCL